MTRLPSESHAKKNSYHLGEESNEGFVVPHTVRITVLGFTGITPQGNNSENRSEQGLNEGTRGVVRVLSSDMGRLLGRSPPSSEIEPVNNHALSSRRMAMRKHVNSKTKRRVAGVQGEAETEARDLDGKGGVGVEEHMALWVPPIHITFVSRFRRRRRRIAVSRSQDSSSDEEPADPTKRENDHNSTLSRTGSALPEYEGQSYKLSADLLINGQLVPFATSELTIESFSSDHSNKLMKLPLLSNTNGATRDLPTDLYHLSSSGVDEAGTIESVQPRLVISTKVQRLNAKKKSQHRRRRGKDNEEAAMTPGSQGSTTRVVTPTNGGNGGRRGSKETHNYDVGDSLSLMDRSDHKKRGGVRTKQVTPETLKKVERDYDSSEEEENAIVQRRQHRQQSRQQRVLTKSEQKQEQRTPNHESFLDIFLGTFGCNSPTAVDLVTVLNPMNPCLSKVKRRHNREVHERGAGLPKQYKNKLKEGSYRNSGRRTVVATVTPTKQEKKPRSHPLKGSISKRYRERAKVLDQDDGDTDNGSMWESVRDGDN